MSIFPEPPASKSAVRKAGKAIGENAATDADELIVDQWRSAHGYVLNTFKIFFWRRIVSSTIHTEFAQRLKRRRTVIDKLRRRRPDGTPLVADVTTMHDLAGCRLIFDSLSDLERFRSSVNSTRSLENVRHTLKNDTDKYDYIKNPKSSGYRGIHDVFIHRPRAHRESHKSEPWHGLLIEVQYRTRVQHAWATALEISDLIDGQRTKFDLHETDRVRFFALASEILARHYESRRNAFKDVETNVIVEELMSLESSLGILSRLHALRQFGGTDQIRRHNVLNMTRNDAGILELEVLTFRSARQAIDTATILEATQRSINAVYVSAENPNQLRSAYRNYFNDTFDFVTLVREATGRQYQ